MAGERGEYRAILCALLDGPDFQRLTAEQRWTFVALKVNLGPSGIDVRYPEALAHELSAQTGHDVPVVKDALNALCREHWVKIQGNVVWIFEQLQHDPAMRPVDPKHRKSIQRHVAGLPHLPIVEAFKERYADWFADEAKAPVSPQTETPKGPARPFEGPSVGLERAFEAQDQDGNQDEDQDIPGSDEPAGEQPEPVQPKSWSEAAGLIWEARFGGTAAYKMIAGHLKPLVKKYGEAEVLSVWKGYLDSKPADYANPADFAQKFGEWRSRQQNAVAPAPDILLADCTELLRQAGPQVKVKAARAGIFDRLSTDEPAIWDRSGPTFMALEFVPLANAANDFERTKVLRGQLERLALRTA